MCAIEILNMKSWNWSGVVKTFQIYHSWHVPRLTYVNLNFYGVSHEDLEFW